MLLRVAHLKHLNPQAVCRRYSKGFKGLYYCQVALVEIPHNFGKNLKMKLGIYKRGLNITTHKKIVVDIRVIKPNKTVRFRKNCTNP